MAWAYNSTFLLTVYLETGPAAISDFPQESSQAMLEDEHPDWLDPISHCPLATMEPLEDYEEDCENAPEEIQKEIDENRRAWANCKDSWLVWVVL